MKIEFKTGSTDLAEVAGFKLYLNPEEPTFLRTYIRKPL